MAAEEPRDFFEVMLARKGNAATEAIVAALEQDDISSQVTCFGRGFVIEAQGESLVLEDTWEEYEPGLEKPGSMINLRGLRAPWFRKALCRALHMADEQELLATLVEGEFCYPGGIPFYITGGFIEVLDEEIQRRLHEAKCALSQVLWEDGGPRIDEQELFNEVFSRELPEGFWTGCYVPFLFPKSVAALRSILDEDERFTAAVRAMREAAEQFIEAAHEAIPRGRGASMNDDPFVQVCLELDEQLRDLPAERAARLLSAMVDRSASPDELARQALGPDASSEQVSRLARSAETAVKFAPAAISVLARAFTNEVQPALDRRSLNAVAPLVVRRARQVAAADRAPVAALLSHLVDVAFRPDLAPLFRRSLRGLFLKGPREVSLAALPGLLQLDPSFAADEGMLGRLDLLLTLGVPRATRAQLGVHLAQSPELTELLLGRAAAGSTPNRWRAAMLLGCVADSAEAVEHCSSTIDLVALGRRLLEDESMRVWRAAATALGRLAAHLTAAREALFLALAPGAELRAQRHAAPALGALLLSHESEAQQVVDRLLSRGADAWTVGSLVFALLELAEQDPDRFAPLVERLAAARGPAVPPNLAAVARTLALTGYQRALAVVGPVALQAVEQWQPRDAAGRALRWAAIDALASAGLREAPPSLGSAVLGAARAALDAEQAERAEELVRRAVDLGWAQLRRIDEADTSVGLEGRGRLLFEVRDLGEALFEEDLLFGVLGALGSRERPAGRALAADYEQLREETRQRLRAGLANVETLDRFRQTELARAITMALDGRASATAALPERLEDRVAAARNLAWFEPLTTLSQRPDRPVRRIAAAGLARFFSKLARLDAVAPLEAALALLSQSPDAALLADAGKLMEEPVRPLLLAVAGAAQSWTLKPDLRGAITAENLRVIAEHASPGSLCQALVTIAAAIEDLASRSTVEAISAAAVAAVEAHPIAILPPAVRETAMALRKGIDGLRLELLGSAGGEEAERIRLRMELAHRSAWETAERVERAAQALLDQGEELSNAEAAAARVNLSERLARTADELVAALREGLALPIGDAFGYALEAWRDALASEEATAREAVTLEAQREADAPEAIPATDIAVQKHEAGTPEATAAMAVAEQTREAASAPAKAIPPTLQLGPGARIGDYELVARLGEGGMGSVWKARQVSLDRYVAFKLLKADAAASADGRERFRQEARLMGRWCHDNILRVIDYQDEGFFLPYIVTELVQGQSLLALSNKGEITAQRIVQIGHLVARGLAHAHAAAVVHRDLSPDNVLIRNDGQVLLMDFGIARLIGRERKRTSDFYMGKPDYSSPEHLSGESELGPETDIYAFGVMLYELLAKELPFPGPTIAEIRGRKLRGAPRPLSEACPGLPEDLCALVHSMLATDGAARPTAAAVGTALQQIAVRMAPTAPQAAIPRTVIAEIRAGEVCVLCLHLCNLDRVTDERWLAVFFGWWYQTAREIIERCGGLCDRHVSDRVYGFFGVQGPGIEDHAVHALQAARQAGAAVRGFAQSSGQPVLLRAGAAMGSAHLGRVLSASPALTVTGGVVQRAEALALSDLDAASLRADERLRTTARGKIGFSKRQSVDPRCGRVFFVEEQG